MPQGSCLCGKTTYSYEPGSAAMKAICHCLSCRKITGSTYATTILIPEHHFTVPNTSASSRKIAVQHESGMELILHGCQTCPSVLYKTASGFPGAKIVFAGTLEGKEDVSDEGKPGAEIWVKYRVPWLKPLEGTAQFEEFPLAS